MFKPSTLCLVMSLIFFSPAVSALGQDSRGSAATSAPSTELGRRHEQDGDLGRALAAFELARWYDPRNASVRTEIERLRSMLGAPDDADGWRAPFRYLTIREWSFVLLAAAAGLGGLALARGLRKTAAPSTSWRKWAAASLVVVLASSVTGLILQSERLDEAIVHDSDARVLLSPASAAQVVGSLHAGERVAVEGMHRSYLLVRSRSGLVGWLPSGAAMTMTGASPAPSQTMER
jgi:hypothetical protein